MIRLCINLIQKFCKGNSEFSAADADEIIEMPTKWPNLVLNCTVQRRQAGSHCVRRPSKFDKNVRVTTSNVPCVSSKNSDTEKACHPSKHASSDGLPLDSHLIGGQTKISVDGSLESDRYNDPSPILLSKLVFMHYMFGQDFESPCGSIQS